MLINLSNHPSSKWSSSQREAAHKEFGQAVDLPFPQIDPHAESPEVYRLAWQYVQKCRAMFPDPSREHDATCPARDTGDNPYRPDEHPICTCIDDAVHLMGETSFVVAFASMWDPSVALVCSTTERVVEEGPDGQKVSTFKFVQFRLL